MKVIGTLVVLVLLAVSAVTGPTVLAASQNIIAGASNVVDHAPPNADSIPPGTIITMQNWQNYRRFMPDGMAALFEGKYFWKMPPDVQMEVSPTIIVPLPKNYLAATEKYASQVKVIELPDGGLTLQGYRGGIAFPNPQEPHRGWKVPDRTSFRHDPLLRSAAQASAAAKNDKTGKPVPLTGLGSLAVEHECRLVQPIAVRVECGSGELGVAIGIGPAPVFDWLAHTG